MRKENILQIPKERRADMVAAIKSWFADERGEEIGDLAAGLLLDFLLENIAPEFYNQGVDDSYRFMKDTAEDLLSIRR